MKIERKCEKNKCKNTFQILTNKYDTLGKTRTNTKY